MKNSYIKLYIYIQCIICQLLPVVPHKAVAKVSKIRAPIGRAGCCDSRMAERIH